MLNFNVIWILVIMALGASTVTRAEPRDLGPISSEASYGNLTDKYVSLSNRDIRVSLGARYFLDNSRIFFNTGIGKIPPLDPLKVAKPGLAKINDEDVTGTIIFSDFILKGAQQYKLDELEIRLKSGRVDFSFDVPKLYVEVNYRGDIMVDESKNYFDGHANVSFYNVHVSGAFSVAARPPDVSLLKQRLEVVGLYYNVASEDLQYNLKNQELSNSAAVPPRRVRRAAKSSDFVKAAAREIAKVASQSVALTFVNKANDILADYSPDQILSLLLDFYY